MWRKKSPSVEDVAKYKYWWVRNTEIANYDTYVMSLDVASLCDITDCENDDETPIVIHDWRPLVPSDWGNEWAPCLLPKAPEVKVVNTGTKHPRWCGKGVECMFCRYQFTRLILILRNKKPTIEAIRNHCGVEKRE